METLILEYFSTQAQIFKIFFAVGKKLRRAPEGYGNVTKQVR